MTWEFTKEDLVIHKTLSKDPKDYKSKIKERKYVQPIQVRIALKNLDKNLEGRSIVSFIITKHEPLIDGILAEYFTSKIEWDREYYWNNQIFSVLERILILTFKDHNWDQYYIKYDKPKKRNSKRE